MENFELWLAVDESGNAAVSMDGPSEAREAVPEDFESAAIRVAKLSVAMELPEVPEISVEVPSCGEAEPIEADASDETHAAHAEKEEERELEPA
jgi:hypothetical protein